MMFKELTKSAKAMAKADTLLLGRIEDDYYICNGHWLAKVNKGFYEAVFRPVSARFIPLEDQEGARSNDKKSIPEKGPMIDFKTIIGNNTCLEDNLVHVTNFMEETKRALTRIIENGNTFMNINEDYFQMMKPLADKWYGEPGQAYKPIYSDFESELAALILPIRPEENAKYQVVNTRKAGE